MANLSAFGGAQPITPGGLVELGYADSDANLSVNATVAASMTNISPELTVVCDGSPVMVEFFCAGARATHDAAGTTDALWFTLKVDGSVEEERLGVVGNVAGGYGSLTPIKLSHRMTPSAGSHTFRVGGWVSNASRTGYIGGGSPYPPAWIRVSKIVQQNDGLKPFWTPPIVTQLPTLATVGDQVVYAADATNGVYWSLYYDGIGTYPWKFVGGAPLTASTTAGLSGTITSTGFVASTPDLAVALPLSGDYWTTTTALATNNTAGAWWMLGLNGPGSAVVDQLCARVMQHANGNWFNNGAHSIKRTFTSSGTVQMQYRVTAGTATFAERGFSLTPIRVA